MELEINNFGAILQYGVYLEQESERFYAEAAQRAASGALREALAGLAEEAQRRQKTLERIRRENITEMILTPIHDFHSRDYRPDFRVTSGDEALRNAAVALETVKARYYADARRRIELAEAGRALGRLARGSQEMVDALTSLALG